MDMPLENPARLSSFTLEHPCFLSQDIPLFDANTHKVKKFVLHTNYLDIIILICSIPAPAPQKTGPWMFANS